MLNFGLAILFFLPIIESFSRPVGYLVLIIGSLFLGSSLVRSKTIRLDVISIFFFLTLLTFIPTIYTSWSLSRSFSEFLRYFSYFILYLTIVNQKDNTDRALGFFRSSILINSFILSVISLLYFLPFLKLPVPGNGMNLFYPSFGHNRLVILLIMAFPLSTYLWSASKRRIYLFLTAFFLVMILTTLGRGAIISLGIAIFIYLYFIHRHNPAKKAASAPEKSLIYIFFAFGILTLILVSGIFLRSNFLKNTTTAKMNWYKPAGNELRFAYWLQSLTAFKQSPLFGSGLDTFRYASTLFMKEKGESSWYSHNHFLQLFTESGIAGGLSFLILTVLIIKFSFDQARKHDLSSINFQQILFIIIVSSILHNLIDYDWQYYSIFMYFWLGVGLLGGNISDSSLELKKKNFTVLYLFFLALIITRLLFLPDSPKLISQADKLTGERSFDKAQIILRRAYLLDKANSLIYLQYADLYEYSKNYQKAHFWYSEGIKRNFFNSVEEQKDDYLLYLRQSKDALDQNDFFSSIVYLKQAVEKYPGFIPASPENTNYLRQIAGSIEKKDNQTLKDITSIYLNYLTVKSGEI